MSQNNHVQIIKILLLSGLFSIVFSQSNSFNLTWDANTETDIYQYKVFRSLTPGASQEIAMVQHPTVNYRDNNVEKGVLYYYRLKAVDFSLNASEYSQEVSAAIPLISGLQGEIILTSRMLNFSIIAFRISCIFTSIRG